MNGRKASHLRVHFGEHAVVEPPEPGFPYGRTLTKPVLDQLAEKIKQNPLELRTLFGPNRMSAIAELSPGLENFFSRSVEIAQSLYNETRPDIIVGSSLGGGVAMAINSRQTPMVLVGPVWNQNIRSGISADHLPGTAFLKRLALNAATVALRGPIARFAGFSISKVVKPGTIILHSAHDAVFDISNSHALIRNSPIAVDDPWRGKMEQITNSLTAAGYGNRKSSMYADYNDGRLIIIGKDHHTNEPDPKDRHNRDAHPHNALVTAVRALLEVSAPALTPARL